MVAERGRLVPVPSVMERGSPGSLNFGGRGLCDLETADSAVSKECPSTPGMIQPAGNPEKNHRTCKIGVPLLHIRSEGENSTPSMSAGEKARQKRLASSPPPILGSRVHSWQFFSTLRITPSRTA